MSFVNKKTFFYVLIIFSILFGFVNNVDASASHIYIAQNAAGLADGTSCSNAYAVTFFNSAGNWGSGSTQIGPGTNVHICGTISTTLATQGSGSSGSPVILFFESGSRLSKGAWGITSSAAIYISGEDYITVDGNNVGVIESTDNGTGLGTQQQAHGIDITNGSTDITVKNLTIQNIYVGNSVDGGVTDPNEYGRAIYADNTSNLTINNNTISHGGKIILYSFRAAASNINIYNNTISNFIVGITVGSAGTGVAEVLDGLNIYNNTITPGTNWNGCWQVSIACDTWHHQDGIHIFAKQNANTQVLNARIYNNYIGDSHSVYTSGTVKSAMTAWIYTEGNPGTIISPWIYNNVLVATSGSGINPTNAFYYLKETTGSKFYNNTVYGNGAGIGMYISNDSSADIQNNIFYDLSQTVQYYGAATAPIADFNIHYSITTLGFEDELNTSYTTLANWQTILGGCPNSGNECSSSVSQPALDGSYGPTVSDGVAKDSGTDLSAYFNTDKSGNLRPSGGAWDIGAYEYISQGGGGNRLFTPRFSSPIGINTSGTEVTLSWISQNTKEWTIEWKESKVNEYKKETKIDNSGIYEHRIESLEPNTQYDYIINIIGDYGRNNSMSGSFKTGSALQKEPELFTQNSSSSSLSTGNDSLQELILSLQKQIISLLSQILSKYQTQKVR